MWGNDAERREFGKIWPLWHDARRRDRGRAVQRLRELADQGYAPAQYALGWAYFDGDGVRRDYVKAFDYILAAANEKYPAAEGMVGAFYAMVKPKHGACPHDPAEAVRWYRRSAEHGNIGAMVNLATCYKSGLGVDEDLIEVYVWASLAVSCSPIRNRPAVLRPPLPNPHHPALFEADPRGASRGVSGGARPGWIMGRQRRSGSSGGRRSHGRSGSNRSSCRVRW